MQRSTRSRSRALQRTLVFAVIAVSALTLRAGATNEFSFNDLLALIDNRNIRSIEALADALPEEFQRNITFRLKPRNRLQEGIRAIRFTDSGSLTLTHSDRPDVKGGKEIEAIERRPDGTLRLRVLRFRDDASGPPQVVDGPSASHGGNPESCVACHGHPPRMIWPSYRVWKDACGEVDDLLANPYEETNELACRQFLASAKENPRFRALLWNPDNPNWPYQRPGAETDNQLRRLSEMPNTRLSYLVHLNNADQMALTVSSSPLFKKLKYGLLALSACPASSAFTYRLSEALISDRSLEVPPHATGQRRAYISSLFERKNPVQDGGPDPKEPGWEHPNLFELFGIPLGNTGANEQLTRNGRTSISYGGSLGFPFTSERYLVQRLLHVISTDDALVRSVLEKGQVPDRPEEAHTYQGVNRGLNRLKAASLSQEAVDSLCPHLMDRALEELAAFERENKSQPDCSDPPMRAAWRLPIALGRANAELAAVLQEEQLIERGRRVARDSGCIACHDPSDGHAVGPRIELRSAAGYARSDQFHRSIHDRSLLERTKELLASKSGAERMPLNRPALSSDDQLALIRYLEHLERMGPRQP